MPNIRMVWFDIGNVLYDSYADGLMSDLAENSNPRLTPHEVYGKITKGGLVVQYDLGLLSTEYFGIKIQQLLGIPDRQWLLSRWQKTLKPSPGVWRLVTLLRQNAYPMGIISNTNELHISDIEEVTSCGSIMQFRPRIYSCREGVDKPNPQIYEIALRRAQSEYPWRTKLTPAECVFIDDRRDNIEVARAMGWYAIHHNPVWVTKTFLQLSELGVRI
ncbi:MAG: HAD family phosphatase [bacterium]|nr:HAD family phosphatase [bacterium]